jgi:hypothetical protein
MLHFNYVMKSLFLILILIFSSVHIQAQDRWLVTHNGKEVVAATAEDTVANRVTATHGDLKKWGALRLQYQETPERPDWKRTLFISDGGQTELKAVSRNKLKLRNRILRKWLRNSGTLFIYTSSIPADPERAATVRVRRVHLCTLLIAE